MQYSRSNKNIGGLWRFAPQAFFINKDMKPTVRERLAYMAQEQAMTGWQWELRANRKHKKDTPGFHIDEGRFVNQLRFHDEAGVLRGVVRLHHKPKGNEADTVYDWDDFDEDPGFLWVIVDPARQNRGIGMALLVEAYFKRDWKIDLDAQERRTIAGVGLIRKFRKQHRV